MLQWSFGPRGRSIGWEQNTGGLLFCPEMAVIETVSRVMKSFLSGIRARWEKLFFSHHMNNLLFCPDFYISWYSLFIRISMRRLSVSSLRKSGQKSNINLCKNQDKKANQTCDAKRIISLTLLEFRIKNDFMTRATVSITAISGQNSNPSVSRFYKKLWFHRTH